MYMGGHCESSRGNSGSRDELDLRTRVQTLRLVAGFCKSIGEGHAVAGGVRGRDELFRARLAVLALSPARPCDGQLRESSAFGFDMPTAARQVTFPRRIRPTDRSHFQPP